MLIELPYSFSGRIFRSPMPFGPYDRDSVWQSYREEEIDLVVVLTEVQEYLVYARRDLPEFYRSQGLEVLHLPVPDFGIPDDLILWERTLNSVAQAGGEGKNIAVHCLAGIGRTGVFLACLAKENLELDGERAIIWVRESVRGAMENEDQEQFVKNYQPSGID
jgi:protein-tyrosine phosphatase